MEAKVNKKNINVFTDGSCTANGKNNAKAGIGIHFPDKDLDDISEPFILKPITNQRAELYAIKTAIDKVINNFEFDKLTIYSDSLYSIKCLSVWMNKWEKNNWKTANRKPVKNIDIIMPLNNILKKYKEKIVFKHVKAHTKKEDYESLCNAIADKLACKATNIHKS